MNSFSYWTLWSLTILGVICALASIFSIGKEREPRTRAETVLALILWMLMLFACVFMNK